MSSVEAEYTMQMVFIHIRRMKGSRDAAYSRATFNDPEARLPTILSLL